MRQTPRVTPHTRLTQGAWPGAAPEAHPADARGLAGVAAGVRSSGCGDGVGACEKSSGGTEASPPPPPCGHGPDTSLPTLPGPWEMRVRTRKRLNLPQQQPRLAGLGAQSRGRPPTAGCGTPGCWTWTSLLIVEVRDCSVIVHVKTTRRFSHEQEPGVRTMRLIPVRPPPRVLLAGSQSPHSSALGAVLAPPVAGTAQPWGLGTSANGTQKAVTFAFVRPRWGT